MSNLYQAQAIRKKPNPVVAKRIHVIDALRGATLFGILIIHSYASFMDILEVSSSPELLNGLEKFIMKNVGNLFSNTLYSIFSFLFGLSFAIQLQSALSKRKPFNRKFIWRLIVLLFIGYCHSLFFERDILQLYALLGILLVFFATIKNRTILIYSAFLFIASLLITSFHAELSKVIAPLGETLRESNFTRFLGLHKFEAQFLNGRLFSTASLFLLGLYAGRKNVFEDNTKNRRVFGKILALSLSIVIISFVAYQMLKVSHIPISKSVYGVEKIAQSFFYVSFFVTIYRVGLFQKILKWLVPTGKMGLTTYIMQSLFIITFYGINDNLIITQLGLASAMGITCIFFVCQMLFATWWISKYRYGPLEWLWRSITYLEWQPLHKAPHRSDHLLR